MYHRPLNDDDTSMQGTGAEFGRIDLGDLGVLVIEDDGDPDDYLRVHFEGENAGFSDALVAMRSEIGDTEFQQRVQQAPAGSDDDDDGYDLRDHVGNMICDGCGLTWPKSKDQTPDDPVNTCPECDDGN